MNTTLSVEPFLYKKFFCFWFLSLLPTLLLYPTWFVAKYLRSPKEKEKEEGKEEKEDELPYEEQYRVPPVDTNASKETVLSNIILEETPKGFVAMRYNKEEEAFEYWANTSIDYKYLDTVARKYVHSFCCFGVYINRFEMLKQKMLKLQYEVKENKKQMELELERQQQNETQKIKEEADNVFAVLKRVTRKPNNKYKTEITKADMVCDASNKFICRGKLTDPKKWLKNDPSDEEKKQKSCSWFEWKHLTTPSAPATR